MNIAHLAHDAVGVGDDEAGEATVVLFEPVGALCVWLARHFRMEVSKLLAELFDLALCLQVLEGAADGDGAQGPSVEFGMSLHDIEGALRGKRVVVSLCISARVGHTGKHRNLDDRGGVSIALIP